MNHYTSLIAGRFTLTMLVNIICLCLTVIKKDKMISKPSEHAALVVCQYKTKNEMTSYCTCYIVSPIGNAIYLLSDS